MRKARLGIIGCGGLAQSQHIPNIYLSRNAELANLCDLREDVIGDLSAKYNVPAHTTDYREILADKTIDGVVIVTKHDTHVQLTVEALNAGKHVYVEKPLAETEVECLKVETARQASGREVIVGMNRRMAPAYRMAKQLLDRNGGARNMFYRIADAYCLYGKSNRLLHELCHVFDILRYFSGCEAASIYYQSSRPEDENILIKFTNGTVASILSSGYAYPDFPKEHFEAIAENGALTVDDFTELRQFSLADDFPARTNFKGHFHPDHDIIGADMMKDLGAEAMYSIRRISWEYRKLVSDLEARGLVDSEEYRQAIFMRDHMPLQNYFMDKGWLGAIEHFADIILTGCANEAASVYDGLMTAKLTQAAIESRETNSVVYL